MKSWKPVKVTPKKPFYIKKFPDDYTEEEIKWARDVNRHLDMLAVVEKLKLLAEIKRGM